MRTRETFVQGERQLKQRTTESKDNEAPVLPVIIVVLMCLATFGVLVMSSV